MTTRRGAAVLVACLLAGGCRGPEGKNGGPGLDGPQGPLGPPVAPPRIDDVTPPVASPGTILRVRGAGFVPDAAGNVVTLDGVVLEVVSASATELRARGVPAADPRTGSLTVLVQEHLSNSAAVGLAPRGTSRPAIDGGPVDPRGLAVDGDGAVLVFDAARGVLRLDASGVLSVHTPAAASLPEPACGVRTADALVVCAGAAIVRLGDDGSRSVLASDVDVPTGMAVDDAGNVHWVSGGASVGRVLASGVVETAFATVPAAADVERVGSFLYVSDPGGGEIHRVALPGGAVTAAFVTGLPGVHGLATDGTDLLALVPDGGGQGAVRITPAGVVSTLAPERPLPDGSVAGSGAVWAGSGLVALNAADLGVDRWSAGAGWSLAVPHPGMDGQGAVFAGDAPVLAFDNRCGTGGDGAVAAIGTAGTMRVLSSSACAGGSLAVAPAGILVADRRDGAVTRLDPVSGAATALVAAGAAGARGIAAAADGSFYMALDDAGTWTVAHHDAAGTLVAADVTSGGAVTEPAGVATSGDGLFVALQDRILRVPLDAQGAPAGAPVAIVPAAVGFSTITSISGDGAGGAWFLDGQDVFHVDATGSVSWVFDAVADRIAYSPFGDLLLIETGAAPVARLL